MELNSEQEHAASVVHGTYAIIACPGSGKTRAMMERIGRLVDVHGISPESILGLTFTKNAATEMRNRLVPVLGDKAERVLLQTIHGFCFMFLKREGVAFEINSELDQLILIKKTMREQRVKDISPGLIIREISLAKNNLISAEEFKELHAGDETMEQIGQIYEAYDREKRKQLVLDFDDLLVQTHSILSTSDRARKKYSGTFLHILVDEFQDTNPLQVEILRLLMNGQKDSSFWVAGDDWQSIYGFMGATVGNILRFKDMFKDSQEYHLTVNYRSTPEILDACRNLISNNERKIEKELRTDNESGKEVAILECVSEDDEARTVASEIEALVENEKFKHKDIVILVRANYQTRAIEETLAEMKVPYHIEGSLNYYDRREVRALLDYLRVINDPNTPESEEALKGIINVPTRYVSRKLMGDLEEYAHENKISLYQAMRSAHIDNPFIRKNIRKMLEFLDQMMADKESLSTAEMISSMRTILDLDRFMTDDDIPDPTDLKVANMNELQLSAVKYTIPELLQHAATFKEGSKKDKDGVTIMTIHKAKGLEYEAVFMVGLVEGILPTKKGDIEEERRIAFVGMSRAKKLLYLSYFTSCLNGQKSVKSSFIDEIKGKENNKIERSVKNA